MWVWVKMKRPGDRRFKSLVPFTRLYFGYPVLTRSHVMILELLKAPASYFFQPSARLAEGVILLLVTLELCMTLLECGLKSGFICLFQVDVVCNVDGFVCESAEGRRTSLVLETCEMMSKAIVAHLSKANRPFDLPAFQFWAILS